MKQNQPQPTYLAAVLWPETGLLRDILLILAGSLFIALTAQITLPMWPVPLTGQTFGVLFVAALLGRRGAASVLVYLGQGAMGLPVFAAGGAGIGQLFGPTGGYLLGFVAAAYIVGWLCELGWDRKVATAVVAMIIGNIIIYTFGIIWLANFVGWDQVVALGVGPFIPGDILKIIFASLLLPAGWKLLGNKHTK